MSEDKLKRENLIPLKFAPWAKNMPRNIFILDNEVLSKVFPFSNGFFTCLPGLVSSKTIRQHLQENLEQNHFEAEEIRQRIESDQKRLMELEEEERRLNEEILELEG